MSASIWICAVDNVDIVVDNVDIPVKDEPAIITLDNVAKFLKTQRHNSAGSNPDVFDVSVQAVIKTKDAPNVPKQFYLQV